MVSAIFRTHGKSAYAILESIQMVYGDAGAEAVEFVPSKGAGDTMAELEKLVSIHNQGGWLIAMGLRYSSPQSAVVILAIRNPRLRAISDPSLPPALGLVDSQDNMNIDELCEHLTQIVKRTYVVWKQMVTAEEDF